MGHRFGASLLDWGKIILRQELGVKVHQIIGLRQSFLARGNHLCIDVNFELVKLDSLFECLLTDVAALFFLCQNTWTLVIFYSVLDGGGALPVILMFGAVPVVQELH